MARLCIAILTLLLGSALIPARAQDSFDGGRLSLERIGEVKPGAYLAGDSVHFALVSDGDNFLLRFDNNPEVFVLYTGHASLGGRILKYDSGETVLQVAGWGGANRSRAAVKFLVGPGARYITGTVLHVSGGAAA